MCPCIADAGGLDQNGAARLLIAGGDVEGVEMVADGAVEKSLGHQIHGVGVGIDDGCSDDAFLVETGSGDRKADTCRWLWRVPDRVEDVDLPELGAVVGVNRVDRIRLGDDVDDVVRALTGNVHVGNVEGLGHHHISRWER